MKRPNGVLLSADKKSLSWRHGQRRIETDLMKLFYGGNVSKWDRDVKAEGQRRLLSRRRALVETDARRQTPDNGPALHHENTRPLLEFGVGQP